MSLDPDILLSVLRDHQGAKNGITAQALVNKLIRRGESCNDRDVRKAVEHLREKGHHVCALPGRGYYLALTAEELEHSINYLRDRALCSLKQISAMRRVAVPDLLGQLRAQLDFESGGAK